jgi:glycosyltransferase involved in cell wall biosynthesis
VPPDLAGKKIAHLTTVDISLEYLLLPQMKAALAAGAEVIGISAPGTSVPRVEAAGIRHVALPSSTRSMNPGADARAARALWHILRAERPDVLHTHNPKPGLYGRVVGRLARVPAVVNTVHGLFAMPTDKLSRRVAVYGLEAIASRCSDAELVQNEEDLALMRRYRLAPAAKLHHLGNGVDLRRFDPRAVSEATRAQLRAEIGAAPSDVVVGMVGRLVYEKGYRELIAAAASLPAHVVVVTIGEPDVEKPDALRADEIAQAEAAGVRFLGQRADVRDLYAAMDIAVLASYREGLPRVLMEAAAMARPLVATDVRGCRQVVRDGENGLLVAPKDATSLAAAIERLAADEDLRRRFGTASRARAEAEFDEDKVVATVLRTYAAALR